MRPDFKERKKRNQKTWREFHKEAKARDIKRANSPLNRKKRS
jgi:hypothetical protein